MLQKLWFAIERDPGVMNNNGSNAAAAAFGAPKSLAGRRTRGTNNKLVYPCRVEGWLNIYGKCLCVIIFVVGMNILWLLM